MPSLTDVPDPDVDPEFPDAGWDPPPAPPPPAGALVDPHAASRIPARAAGTSPRRERGVWVFTEVPPSWAQASPPETSRPAADRKSIADRAVSAGPAWGTLWRVTSNPAAPPVRQESV